MAQHMKTRKHEFKIINDPLNNGKFQVRIQSFPDGITPLWADAGDACDTRKEAEAKLAEFMAMDKGLWLRDDGRWDRIDG